MAITSTNYTDISYIEEVTPGTTPATPTFQILPTKGGSPQGNITTAVSEVIRSDRQTDDLVVVDSDVAAEVNFELSYTPYKPLLTSLLQGAAATVINISSASDIAAAFGSPSSFTSSSTDFVTAGLKVGHFFQVAGFVDSANNGVFKATSVATNAVEVSQTLVTESAPASVDVSATVVRNGAETPVTYSILKRVQGANAPYYFYYNGCIASAASFRVESGAILDGSISFIGREEDSTDTAKSGQTLTAIPAYTIMNAVSSVLEVEMTAVTGQDTRFSTMDMAINNNVEAAKAVGTLGAFDLASFSLDVTADMNIYFEDIAIYTAYKNSSSFSIGVVYEDGDGNRIAISMPYCKFESLDTPIDGKDAFFMANGTVRGLRDPVNNYMVQFSFMPAA